MRRSGLFLAFCLIVFGSGARADQSAALQSILGALAANEPAEQSRQIIEAIDSSPQLSLQLSDLAAAKKLTAIHIVPQKNWGKPFNAIIQGDQMIMTVEFVNSQSKRIYDVGADDHFTSRNIAYCLGHLAYHLAAPAIDMRGLTPVSFGEKKIAEEANAFIAGWNIVADASGFEREEEAERMKHVSVMLMNLRYRFAFIKAMNAPEKLQISPNGRVEPTERNVTAIATALKTSTLTDLE